MSTLNVNGFPMGIDARVAVTTQVVHTDDYWFEGRRYRDDGVLRVVINNAPTTYIGGIGYNALGQMCVSLVEAAADHYVNALAINSTEQLLVSPGLPVNTFVNGWPMFVGIAPAAESMIVPFNDLGNGVVDILATTGNNAGLAHIRASPAYTTLANGTLKQVGNNVPRSYYAPFYGVHDGPEEVLNGEFNYGLANWSVVQNAVVNIVNGAAQCVSSLTSNEYIQQELTLVEGRRYRCSMEVLASNATGLALRLNGVPISPGGYSNTLGIRVAEFTAPAGPLYVLGVAGTGASSTATFDNISIVELVAGTDYGGYLCEKPSTNLLRQSVDMVQGAWGKDGLTVTADAAVQSPDVTPSFKLTSTLNGMTWINQATGLSGTKAFTASMYVKAGNLDVFEMGVYPDGGGGQWASFYHFDLSAMTVTKLSLGTTETATMEPLANGWVRCTVSGDTDPAAVNHTLYLYPRASGVSRNGDTLYAWGGQCEEARFASTYIPTQATTVTRAGDRLVYDPSNLDPTVGTAYAEVTQLDPRTTQSPSSYLVIDSGSGAGPLSSSGVQNIFFNDGAVTNNVLGVSQYAHRVAVASTWGGVTLSICGGGSSPTTAAFDGSIGGAAWAGISVGGVGDVSNWDGTIRNLRIWKAKVPAEVLQEMTRFDARPYSFLCVTDYVAVTHPIAFTLGFTEGFF